MVDLVELDEAHLFLDLPESHHVCHLSIVDYYDIVLNDNARLLSRVEAQQGFRHHERFIGYTRN